MKQTGLSRASVHSYLPYTKGAYNAKEQSINAERLRKYRERQEAVKKTKNCLEAGSVDLYDHVWETLTLFEDYTFYTAENLKYRYSVRGQEILVNRKDKSITRSTVNLALGNATKRNRKVIGPKHLGVVEASYIFPLFIRLGII